MMRKKSVREIDPSEQLLSTDSFNDRQSLRTDRWNPLADHECQVGIYGWRKKFLYILIILIAALVILNAALTLWIIFMLNFSMYGLGNLKVNYDGITLTGNAFIEEELFATSIKSRKGERLNIRSDDNLTLFSRGRNGNIMNKISIGNSKLSAISNDFKIKGQNGQLLFGVNDQEVTIATETIHFQNSGGLRFSSSIQTPLIQGSAYEELKLISPQRRVQIKAPMSIAMESRLGDFSAITFKELKLKSNQGKISLEAEDIQLRNLKTALPTNTNISRFSPDVYQLCVCAISGSIFISPADKPCLADETICGRIHSLRTAISDYTFMP